MSSKAIFIRVSNDDLSYEKQIPAIINKFNLNINECRIYKEKISAYKDEVQEQRTDFIDLQRDIENGIIKELYVFKIDRLQRNIERSLSFYFFCKGFNCPIYSVNEPQLNLDFGDDAIGIYIKYNLVLASAYLGQAESENTSIRTKSAVENTNNNTFSYKGNKWGKQFTSLDGNKIIITAKKLDQLQTRITELIDKYESTKTKGYYPYIIDTIEKEYNIKLSKAYISIHKNGRYNE